MKYYEKYQVLTAAEQHLFSSVCPVYVHRYQISVDQSTGRRLLQVRLVNMSGKDLRAVYLRINCCDGNLQRIMTMHTVPMTGIYVPSGGIFGEDRIIRLRTNDAETVEVFAERVVFADETAWNEAEAPEYIALPAPIAVQPTDPDYARLAAAAKDGGVENSVRFQALTSGWYCTCGLPNSNWRLNCGYCGANREWLSAHMSRLSPAPSVPVPVPASVPEAKHPEANAGELLAYLGSTPELAPEPIEHSAPAAVAPPQPASGEYEEFPDLSDPQPRRKKSSPGKVLAIVFIILAVLAALGYCGYRYLLPMLRYQEADNLEATGKYAQARTIFQSLGDYSDSRERVSGTRYNEALSLMRAGDYSGAYALLTTIPEYKDSASYAADCLYSQGVLAYNNGDIDNAYAFVQRLRQEYPEYAGTQELAQCCAYSYGQNALEAENYSEAQAWFTEAGSFSNSSDMVPYCSYMLACKTLENRDYATAAELFRALGGYEDSPSLMLECMHHYVQESMSANDSLTLSYLQELIANGYPGSQELYDSLYKWEVSLCVNTSQTDATRPATTVEDPAALVIHYSVTGGAPGESITLVLIYSMPDNSAGSVNLATGLVSGAEGIACWKDLPIAACDATGTISLKICDASDGAELGTFRIQLVAPGTLAKN